MRRTRGAFFYLYATLSPFAPVVKWISLRPSKPSLGVRVPPGAQSIALGACSAQNRGSLQYITKYDLGGTYASCIFAR